MAENFFDQFDSQPSGSKTQANYFDQFDAPVVKTPPVTTEQTPPQASGLPRRLFGDTAVSVAKGITGLGQAAVGLADIPTLGNAGKALESVGYKPQQTNDYLESLYSPEQQQANKNVQKADGFVNTLGALAENPSVAAHAVVESVPSMIGGLGIAGKLQKAAPLLSKVAPRIAPVLGESTVAGAIGEGAVTAGANAEQVRQQTKDGLLTPEQSALAVGSGVLTGGITGGFGKFANKLGVGDANQLLLNKGVQEGLQSTEKAVPKGILRRAVEGGAVEGVQEGLQSAQEQAATNLALGKDIGEGVGNAAALGVVTGAGMGAPVGALHKPQIQPNPSDNPPVDDLNKPADQSPNNTQPPPAAPAAEPTQMETYQAPVDVNAIFQKPENNPTHESLDGTPLWHISDNLYKDQHGHDVHDEYAIPYEGQPYADSPAGRADENNRRSTTADTAINAGERGASSTTGSDVGGGDLLRANGLDRSGKPPVDLQSGNTLDANTQSLFPNSATVTGLAGQALQTQAQGKTPIVQTASGYSEQNQPPTGIDRTQYSTQEIANVQGQQAKNAPQNQESTAQESSAPALIANAAGGVPPTGTTGVQPSVTQSQTPALNSDFKQGDTVSFGGKIGTVQRTYPKKNIGQMAIVNFTDGTQRGLSVNALTRPMPVVSDVAPDSRQSQGNNTPFSSENPIATTTTIKPARVPANTYHPAIESMVKDLTKGGGIAYSRDQHGAIIGRTPSTNPQWYQEWTPVKTDGNLYASKPPVEEVHKAFAAYQKGDLLTAKQQRILQSLSDIAQGEEDYANEQWSAQQQAVLASIEADLDALSEREAIQAVNAADDFDDFIDNIPGFNTHDTRTKSQGESPTAGTESADTALPQEEVRRQSGYEPTSEDLLRPQNAVYPQGHKGSNQLKAKQVSPDTADIFATPEEQAQLKQKQALADLTRQKDAQRQGNARDGGELFQQPDIQGQQDVSTVSHETESKQDQLKAKILANREKIKKPSNNKYDVKQQDEEKNQDNQANQSNNDQIKLDTKIDDLGEKIGGARKDGAAKGYQRGTAQTPKDEQKDQQPAWAKRFEIKPITIGDKSQWLLSDTKIKNSYGHGKPIKKFDTEQEAKDAIPLIAVSMKHRVITSGKTADGNPTYEIWRNINDRKRVKVVAQAFGSRDEAMQYMAANAQKIIETNSTFGEADLPTPDNTDRIGVERRKGDVSGQNFMDSFGFRGVEFGNWNNQSERQQVMNAAYDGLFDLAEVLNIPASALSLNGELALAFGARGQGLSSALAHYERSKAVINLTKMNGAGSLAHEFLHALDHYFGRQDGKAPAQWAVDSDGTKSFKTRGVVDYASHGFNGAGSGVREDLRVAYDQVMETIFSKAENYVEDTEKADNFVGRAKEELAERLDNFRAELSRQKDPKHYKRNNKPASAEQLLEFDTIAKQLLDGENLEVEFKFLPDDTKSKAALKGRRTNEALEKLSAIYKAVRGKSGFDATTNRGVMDNLRKDMIYYDQRLKFLESAKSADQKTKKVPTDFAMNAKELDQGRGLAYWTTPHEMMARAFQAFVEDKISEQDNASPFLNYAPEHRGIITPWGVKYPFPRGKERDAINQAFDKFVAALKVKEGDHGKLILYSKTEDDQGKPRGIPVNVAKVAVNAFMREYNGNIPLTVRVVNRQEDIYGQQSSIENVGRIKGAYHAGTGNFVLVAANMDNLRDGEATIRHELLGHYGLNTFKPADKKAILEKIIASKNHVGLKGIWHKIETIYDDISELKQAEEVFAKIAEQENNLFERAVTLLSALINKALRAVGLIKSPVTRSELKNIVASISKGIKSGERSQQTFPLTDQDQFSRDGGNGQNDTGKILFSHRKPAFYSQLQRAVEQLPSKLDNTSGNNIKAWLQANADKMQVKKDELHWSGVLDWLELQGKAKVSKDDVLNYLKTGGVKVEETTLSKGERRNLEVRQNPNDSFWFDVVDSDGNVIKEGISESAADRYVENAWNGDGDTKYKQYTVHGGKNYKELLLTLPASTNDIYKSSHWDQPNILAHTRFDERTDADGNKTLFIHEIQSDWSADGRKKGFKDSKNEQQIVERKKLLRDKLESLTKQLKEAVAKDDDDAYEKINQERNPIKDELRKLEVADNTLIQPAPFVEDTKAYVGLILKRMAMYAAEHGFQKVAWATGEQSADLYDLQKQVKTVRYDYSDADSNYEIMVQDLDGNAHTLGSYTEDKLSDAVGKDLADKIIEDRSAGKSSKTYSGVDLKVGGEGMKAFYNQIVPQVANDLLKKLGGGKVEAFNLNDNTQQGFTLTEAMTDKILNDGLPLFSKQDPNKTNGLSVAEVKKLLPKSLNKLLSANKLQILQSVGDIYALEGIPSYARSFSGNNVEGFYDTHNDVVYLVADKINNDNLHSVLSHELLHRALNTDSKLASAVNLYKDEMQKRFNLASIGKASPIENKAYQRVTEAKTPKEDRLEEFHAYLVTQWQQTPSSITGKLAKLIVDFISAIRAALFRAGYLQPPKVLTPQLLSQLAIQAGKKLGGKISPKSPNEKSMTYGNRQVLTSFAGERAKTVDLGNLDKAKARLAKGDDAEQVRQDTGFFKGVDGKFRFEIDDSKAKINIDELLLWNELVTGEKLSHGAIKSFGDLPKSKGLKVKDLLEHPALFAAYPELKDIPIEVSSRPSATLGSVTIDTEQTLFYMKIGKDLRIDRLASVMLHELQHVIQQQEGFASGGNTEQFKKTIPAKLKDVNFKKNMTEMMLTNSLRNLGIVVGEGKYLDFGLPKNKKLRDEAIKIKPELKEEFDQLDLYNAKLGKYAASPQEQYMRLAGETEARNAEARQKLTAEERKTTSPFSTQDVSNEDVIIVYNGKEMHSTGEPEHIKQYQAIEAKYFNPDGSQKAGAMLAPNGEPTKLNKRQWIQVRTQAFKDWFGDWESAAIEKNYDSAPVINIKSKYSGDLTQIRKDALTDYYKLRAKYPNGLRSPALDGKTQHGEKGVIKLNSDEKFASNTGDPRKYQIIGALEELFNEAHWYAYAPTYKKGQERNVAGFHYLLAKTGIDGIEFDVAFAVREDNNGNYHHNHTLYRASGTQASWSELEGEANQRSSSAFIVPDDFSLYRPRRKHNTDNVSKVVDSRGEPMVLYHATDKDFAVFDKGKIGARFPYSFGFHFTNRKPEANEYAKAENGNIMPLFISLKNPLSINSGYTTASMEADFNRYDIIHKIAESRKTANPYDGVVIERVKNDDYDGINVIGLESTQIKSATGNTGEYSRSNNDIRFSKAAPKPITDAASQGDEWLKDYIKSKLGDKDTVIYNLQDRMIDLKRQMEKVATGVKDAINPYLSEELYTQRAASRVDEFYKQDFDPILKELDKHKLGFDKFQEFLQARHAPSRNKLMAERNPSQAMIDENLQAAKDSYAAAVNTGKPRAMMTAKKELDKWQRAKPYQGTEENRLALSGISDQQAESFMKGLKPHEVRIMTRLGDQIDKINNETLDLLVAYDMETPEMVAQLKAQWQHYVPLHRDEAHPDDASFGHPVGSGYSIKGSGLKKATGSTAEVTNILAHIAAAREQMIKRGEKNRVTVSLGGFIQAHPDKDFAALGQVPTITTIVNGLTETLPDPMYKTRDNVVMMRVKGKDIGIVFNEEHPNNVRLAATLKNLDGIDLNRVEKFVSKGTRWLSSINTQYNVVFGLFNFARDVQGSMLNLTTTALRGKQAQVLKALPKAFSMIYAAERNDNVNPIYDRFLKAGGTTGFMQAFDNIGERDKSLRDELAKLSAGQPLKMGRAILQGIKDYNHIMENSTRLAAFMTALDNGLSEPQAASIAKNITVNFNRKGAIATNIGAWYGFYNAAIQGNTRLMQTLTGPKGKQIIAGGISLGAMMTMAAIASIGADDWEKIPEFVKERSLIIPAPWNKARYVAIPMPLGFNLLPNIGRTAVESMIGSKRVSPMSRFMNLALSFGDTFNPIGGGHSVGNIVAPSILDPALDLYKNEDFSGKAIYKEDFNSLSPTPGFKRTKDNASDIAKDLSELVNKATGGTDYKAGSINWTPDQIDYIFGTIFGGTGREILKASATAQSLATGEDLALHRIPLIGKVYGESSGNAAERSLYYDNIKRMNEHRNEIEGLTKEGKSADALSYVSDNPDANLVYQAKNIKKQIDTLSDKRELLKKQGKPTNALDKIIGARMKTLNDAVAQKLQ